MRITMGMIANQYKTRLNQSLQALSNANIRATNYRSFNKPSDNPFAAAQTYQVRRETEMNLNYQSNLGNVQDSLKTSESTVRLVSDIVSNADSTDVLGAVNGSMTEDTRSAIVKELRSMRDSIVSDMNAKFSDQYLFGGAGTGSPPFSIDADGNLLYRGVNVDTGVNTNGASATVTNGTSSTQINFGKENGGKLNDYSIVVQSGGEDGITVSADNVITVTLKPSVNEEGEEVPPTKKQLQDVLQNKLKDAMTDAGKSTDETDGLDFSKITVTGDKNDAATATVGTPDKITDKVNLDDLANEKVYVDLGFGLQFDGDGNIVPQSAYNTSLPGISIIGYGMNADGTPKNVYSLMGKIADLLDSDNVSMDTIQPYLDSFRQTESNITTQISDIGAKEKFLTSTQTHLKDTSGNLTEKDNDVEFVEPSDAIMDWMTQQFCYQAALQMGTNILQPTLMDFLK